LLKQSGEKNNILKGTSAGGVNVQQVQTYWDNFEVAVGDFDQIIS
jgi:hypothetical protein